MANRHLSRSIVLQTLFEWDVQATHGHEVNVEGVLKRNVDEFAPDEGDFSYMRTLMNGVIAKQSELDSIIEKAAPEWPIDKISTIDRNILRIGLYELLFGDRTEVPAKVAINEAIELGKNFGGESSGKFINGVLGAVYKDIGEPGKNDATTREGKEMPTKHLCGAVIFARTDDGVKFALVHDVFGKWTLSKSRKDDTEEETDCACRAVKNELGLSAKTIEELGSNEYIAAHPEEGKMLKKVTYFLAEAPYHDIVVDTSGGLNDARWFAPKEIALLDMYEDIRPIIEKAVTLVEKNHG